MCKENGVRFAIELAARVGAPPIAVVTGKHMIPDDWGKRPYRTRTSSGNLHPGQPVEVHIWPSLEDLVALRATTTGHAIIIEYADHDLSGWARHRGAMHYDTKEILAPEVSEEALSLYAKIDWNGNNGWHDAPGKRDALRERCESTSHPTYDP